MVAGDPFVSDRCRSSWSKDAETVSGRRGCALEAAVTFFPRSSGTKAESCPDGPCSSLEDEDGEDDAQGCTECASDEECAEAVVPLLVQKRFAHGSAGSVWCGHGGRHGLGGVGHGVCVYVCVEIDAKCR